MWEALESGLGILAQTFRRLEVIKFNPMGKSSLSKPESGSFHRTVVVCGFAVRNVSLAIRHLASRVNGYKDGAPLQRAVAFAFFTKGI